MYWLFIYASKYILPQMAVVKLVKSLQMSDLSKMSNLSDVPAGCMFTVMLPKWVYFKLFLYFIKFLTFMKITKY